MNTSALKYLTPFILFALAFITFAQTGIYCWLPFFYAWVFIPLIELFLPPFHKNLNALEEELIKKSKIYDLFLYAVVILLYVALFVFLRSLQEKDLSKMDIAGRVLAMGLLCGVFGMNVGHELGHRPRFFEKTLAKASLLVGMYTHFFIEHNKGHHKNVATYEDPGSARLGEIVYAFYLRAIPKNYLNAWKISMREIRKKGKPFFSFDNEMLLLQILQLSFSLILILTFGWKLFLYYLASAWIGIILLETVNYIEHYGLTRDKIAENKYERAMPQHSWNSDHLIGRLMLFELSRHSDHHYLASKKYQTLQYHSESPQMPTGYPGMMLLSLFPHAWFYVMHRQMKKNKLISQK